MSTMSKPPRAAAATASAVDTLTSSDAVYGIYYNAATHQCVQLTNAEDRVASADDIGTHPNCS
jgi:hypothetical protein